MKAITNCKECGSTDLSWDTFSKINSGIEQGRLNTRDVTCLFVLGCNQCSTTLATVNADKLAASMNETRALLGTVTNDQMNAGEAVLAGYKDLHLNTRNAAIDVFDAMTAAGTVAPGTLPLIHALPRHTWGSIANSMIGKHSDDTRTEYVKLDDVLRAIESAAPGDVRAWEAPNGAIRENKRDLLSVGYEARELFPLVRGTIQADAPKVSPKVSAYPEVSDAELRAEYDLWLHNRLFNDPPLPVTGTDAFLAGVAYGREPAQQATYRSTDATIARLSAEHRTALLTAAHTLLKKQAWESDAINLLHVPVTYEGTERDGLRLIADIEDELEIDGDARPA